MNDFKKDKKENLTVLASEALGVLESYFNSNIFEIHVDESMLLISHQEMSRDDVVIIATEQTTMTQ